MKSRISFISFLTLLLVLSPVFGLFAGEAQAASSRVAVIQSMKGTVHVKKAGGSKEFKAFAKMSLNEGDVLTTGAGSSVVLQFSNGTSEDDRMSVAAGTTLTFSKLSDRNGTRTKVSMWSGSAWVDVKSIETKNDEFTLETPTAVMGVRGTHLLVSVDPVTGATRLTVAAGVVNAQPTGTGEARDVKPGDNALVVKDEQDIGEVIIAPADLDLLMQQSDSTIVEAIVAASAEIVLENEEKLDLYLEGVEETSELERMKSNIENLLGAIVDSAIRNGVITEERANELIAQAEAQTGVTVDLSKKNLELSEEEKQKQEEQRRKQEEASRKAEEERRAKEEERRQNEELLKRLEEARKAKEEANRQAEEERRKAAEEEYREQLDEEERIQFEEQRAQLGLEVEQGTSESGSPGGSSGGSPGQPSQPQNPAPGLPYEKAPFVEQMYVRNVQQQQLETELLEKEVIYSNEYLYTYRVITDVNETSVQLELDFEASVNLVYAYDHIYSDVSPDFTDSSENRYIYDIPLQSQYTILYVDYRTDDWEYSSIELIIVKGMSPAIDLNIEYFGLLFGEDSGFAPAYIANDDRMYVGVGTEFDGYRLYTHAALTDEPFTTYKVLLTNGDELPGAGYGGYELELEEGWNEYVIEVTDVAHLFSPRTYTLSIWKGAQTPAAFTGVTVETQMNLDTGPAYNNPSKIYVELNAPVTSVQFKPVHDASLTLDGVYSLDGTKLEADPSGYYSIVFGGEEQWVWAIFSSGSQKFAYQIVFVPGIEDVKLDYVRIYDSSHYLIGEAYFVGSESYFQVPSAGNKFYLYPEINSESSALRVMVNDKVIKYDYTLSDYDPSNPEPVQIKIMSPSGLNYKEYALVLSDKPPLCAAGGEILPGLTCVEGYFDTTGIQWLLFDESPDGQQQSYFVHAPSDTYNMNLKFTLSAADSELYRGQTLIDTNVSGQEYTLSLDPGENVYELRYMHNSLTYSVKFYIQMGPYITHMNIENYRTVNQYGSQYLSVVEDENVYAYLEPEIDVAEFNVTVSTVDPDIEVDVYNGLLEISALKYGMNIITIHVEDRIGGIHSYELRIWRGMNIDLNVAYTTVTGSVYEVPTGIPYEGQYGDPWLRFDVATFGHTANDISEVHLIFTDMGYGFNYSADGQKAVYDPQTSANSIVIKNIYNGVNYYYIRIEDEDEKALYYDLQLYVGP